jgi:creatinine amidohydrolase
MMVESKRHSVASVHRITAGDTVKLAVLAGPADGLDHSVLVEIWDEGGAQPPNSHPDSVETFYFLDGRGEAEVDGRITPVAAGDFVVLAPGSVHRIRNTGPGRLYAVTTMTPDAGFAQLVQRGPGASLDDVDRRTLGGIGDLRVEAGDPGGGGLDPGGEPGDPGEPGPRPRIRHFAHLSGPAVGRAAPGLVAIQPIGSVEHHGAHLPLITDTLVAQAVSEAVVEAAPDLPLVLLPPLSYALSSEHLWAPGTISLGPDTLLRVLDDIGASLARAGISKLVFLNGHGGNSALLRVACRELRVRHGLLTFLAHPSLPVDQGGEAREDEKGYAIHGHTSETSIVMHLRPDLVDLSLAERSIPDWLDEYRQVGFGGDVVFGWTSEDIMAGGVIGDPTAASAEAGKILFEAAVDRLATAFAEITRFDFPER